MNSRYDHSLSLLSVYCRNWRENIWVTLLFLASLVAIFVTIGIVLSIVFYAIEFFQLKSFWTFLTGTEWYVDHSGSVFGAVPIFSGTIVITFIAMAVAIPFGVLSAVYMSEYASPVERRWLKPSLEILAGIPTVVYGFFAALTVAPAVVSFFEGFGVEATYNSALACGVVMGVMIIPVIASLVDDVLRAIPDSQRAGALALGTTDSEMIVDIILPSAMPGIISAVLLGFSKAIGETMIVVMAAGMRPNLTWNPLEDMTTVTVQIVDALVGDHAFNSPHTLSAFALGLFLFVITLVLNSISLKLIKSFKAKYRMD